MLTWWGEIMCSLSSTGALQGLGFCKSWWFICFHKAERRCLLVSRTHTCSLSPAPLCLTLLHIREEGGDVPVLRFLILSVSEHGAIWSHDSLWGYDGNNGTSCREVHTDLCTYFCMWFEVVHGPPCSWTQNLSYLNPGTLCGGCGGFCGCVLNGIPGALKGRRHVSPWPQRASVFREW